MPEIARQNQIICDAAQNAKRRLKIKDIAHRRGLAALGEEVIVVQATKRATDERVAEVIRRVEGRDAACETLPDAEMSGAPSDLLPERHQPGGNARDRTLSGLPGGCRMKVDAARKVEDAVYRCGDLCCDVNHRHGGIRPNETKVSDGARQRRWRTWEIL